MKIKQLKINMIVILTMIVSVSAYSQSIIGKWKTINDETGKTESVVKIWKSGDGLYYGKIIKLTNPAQANNVCSACDKSDPRYNKKIVGMTIISKMKKTDDNEWTNGTILDPGNGKVYKCKIFREKENLMVRGYWGFLYRTQKWLPAK